MALVFVAGWVRSLTQEDNFSLNVFPQRIAADSTLGKVHFFRYENYVQWNHGGKPPFSLLQWETFRAADPEPFEGVGIRAAASGSLNQFGRDAVSPTILTFVIPYWSIVIPMTFVSAYLLLTKPRKTPPKKISEPTHANGA